MVVYMHMFSGDHVRINDAAFGRHCSGFRVDYGGVLVGAGGVSRRFGVLRRGFQGILFPFLRVFGAGVVDDVGIVVLWNPA